MQTVTIGEVELYYETHGSGELLLFLHGFTGSGSDWRFIGEELAARRQVIAPDLRGHGRSTTPSSSATSTGWATSSPATSATRSPATSR